VTQKREESWQRREKTGWGGGEGLYKKSETTTNTHFQPPVTTTRTQTKIQKHENLRLYEPSKNSKNEARQGSPEHKPKTTILKPKTTIPHQKSQISYKTKNPS
jgi:hypothetical protein